MRKKLLYAVLTCLSIGVCFAAEPAGSRQWKTNDGKPAVQAVAVDARYDQATKSTIIELKKADGTTVSIPYSQLDPAGRECAWYDVQRRRAKASGRPFSLPPPGTVKLEATSFAPVEEGRIPETATGRGDKKLLEFAPGVHAFDRPPEGWCGEDAIQEALFFFGAYYPQERINDAGSPAHPDLYANDIPRALGRLGFRYRSWEWKPAPLGDFIAWIRKEIAAGSPVLAGVKINPTAHPEWGLDHFVLVVGTEKGSLLLNTTWGYRSTLSESQLRSTKEGLSFANDSKSYYGISILGPKQKDCPELRTTALPATTSSAGRPVRLFLERETADRLAVIVKCEDLEPGVEYSIFRLSSADEKPAKPQITFKARRTVQAFYDTISRDAPAIYRCQ
jgi:hypothetical protein